jgi:hypothetical protein
MTETEREIMRRLVEEIGTFGDKDGLADPRDYEQGRCYWCGNCSLGTIGRPKDEPEHTPDCPYQQAQALLDA